MTKTMMLHPRGIMQIALDSFRIYFRNFPTLIALSALLYILPLIFIAIVTSLVGEELAIIRIIFFIAGFLGFLVITIYFYAIIILFVSIQLVGFKAGIFQLLKRLRGSVIIQLFGTGLLQALAISGGSLLLIIPGIIFLVNYIFASHVVVLENTAYVRAMRRSRDLVRGNWWRVFGVVALCTLLYVIGYFIISFFLNFLLLMFDTSLGVSSMIANFITTLLFASFAYIYPVLLYYDLRIRKEAFNIEDIREVV